MATIEIDDNLYEDFKNIIDSDGELDEKEEIKDMFTKFVKHKKLEKFINSHK